MPPLIHRSLLNNTRPHRHSQRPTNRTDRSLVPCNPGLRQTHSPRRSRHLSTRRQTRITDDPRSRPTIRVVGSHRDNRLHLRRTTRRTRLLRRNLSLTHPLALGPPPSCLWEMVGPLPPLLRSRPTIVGDRAPAGSLRRASFVDPTTSQRLTHPILITSPLSSLRRWTIPRLRRPTLASCLRRAASLCRASSRSEGCCTMSTRCLSLAPSRSGNCRGRL